MNRALSYDCCYKAAKHLSTLSYRRSNIATHSVFNNSREFIFESKRPFRATPLSFFVSSATTDSFDAAEATAQWKKHEMKKITSKFETEGVLEIRDDEELQGMWRDMESRVTRRKLPPKLGETDRVGRKNVRRWEEDAWLDAGLYDEPRGRK